MTSEQLILQKLDAILSHLGEVTRRIHDVDAVLTEDDIVALRVAEQDFRKGKTKRLS